MKDSKINPMGKTYHWWEGNGEHATYWAIKNTEYCCSLNKKHKEYEDRKKKYGNDTNNRNQDDSNTICNYVMLVTLFQEEYDREWGLRPMIRMFIGMGNITFLSKT